MKMFFNRSLKKDYIHIYILVILIGQALGNGSYLNGRSREEYVAQRNTDSNKLIKGNNNGATNVNNGLVDDGGVRNVGEVFVPKTFPMSSQEPSCEELRAMWIFSKRQSRAAEITNEIPTYRDPFTYNVWEPLYSNSRMLGSIRMGSKDRARSPVFGRVVSREPIVPQRVAFEQRQRHSDGSGIHNPGQSRFYGLEARPASSVSAVSTSTSSSPRRASKNRYMGVPNNSGDNSVAVQGSFQKLKELIWTERAKELTQQRRTEELAARAAVLKEIANGQNMQGPYNGPFGNAADSFLMDENRSPDRSGNQYSNVDRLSIATGQTIDGKNSKSNKNKNSGQRNNAGRASTRRIGSVYGGSTHSTGPRRGEVMFSRKHGQGPNSDTSEINYSVDIPDRDREQDVVGIPRTYPIRQSHFRERNRSLFKQSSPTDYFHRDTRKFDNLQLGSQTTKERDTDIERQTELSQFRPYLNANYLSQSTLFENGMQPSQRELFYFNKVLTNQGEISPAQDEFDFYDYK